MARQNVRNSSDILRLLNRIINLLEHDEIDTNKGRAMIYACSVAGNIIKTIDLEKRIEKLEQKAV